MKPSFEQTTRRRRAIVPVLAGLCLLGCVGYATAATFTVTSPNFADGGMLAKANAGGVFGTSNCGGDNLSPGAVLVECAGNNLKTFAIVISDPDGGGGLGSVHFIGYDIPPSVTSFAEGQASKPSPTFVGGTTSRKLQTYFGPCPPPGEAPHHYHLSVYALDIPPGQLTPGLTREDLFAKIKGHILAQASIIGRYGR